MFSTIKFFFGDKKSDKTINASQGGKHRKPSGQNRTRGRHADDGLCGFTWTTTKRNALGVKITIHHRCINDRKRCDGNHMGDWMDPEPRYRG